MLVTDYPAFRLQVKRPGASAFAVIVVFFLGATTPAAAIPSPELVVGSFTSISQLVALLSAMLGGGAAFAGWRAKERRGKPLSQGVWSLAVGATAMLALSGAANVYQFWKAHLDLQQRLESTLVRATPTADGRTLDPTLKEVSYAEQLASPRGISTEETERLLEAALRGERGDVVFLDIRETAETEMGVLPLSKAIRFPDLPKANVDLAGKTPILLCHNGNRSYETCAALAARGIDCRFMVGGFEKWLVERRSLTGLKARTLADLRAVPPYRNQSSLLTTADVHKEVQEEGAIFVDVRYPGEFESNHLPGAINLPIRPTPTEQLRARISSLPHRPIIAPCYDRRSCFFGEILGLELARAGYDFRGRYTLPWEYFTTPESRPYIEQWLKEAHKTYWEKAAEILAAALDRTAQYIGLPAAIILLAMLSRLLILPFSLKSERDQIRAHAAADELVTIKLRLKEDPARLTRAIRAFYRRHGLTPLRNLVALLFLPIMAMALLAVSQVTATTSTHLLWINDLAQRDGSLALPVLFAALICMYADMAFARSKGHQLIIWLAGLPVMTATGSLFNAGADLYLVTSAALLLVQRLALAGDLQRLWARWKRRGLPASVMTLDEPDRLLIYGNKSLRLAQMRADGMPVPAGVVLPPEFLQTLSRAPAGQRHRHMDAIWRYLRCERAVVRSSAAGEDGMERSFAGVYESVLDVDRAGLEIAIARVNASFTSKRAESYAAAAATGSVLIQPMIAAEYAGVLFTQDPAAGALAMVELIRGTGEGLVSGLRDPETYRFGRASGGLFGEQAPPVDLSALLALGRRAEALFGSPQDIEWTWSNGSFHLVQSRNITTVLDCAQRSLACALDLAKMNAPDEIAFVKNELSELLPRPTPLSLSLMERLWASGGSVDQACRSLGLSYQVEDDGRNYTTSILGRLYLNKAQEQARSLKIGPIAAHRLVRGADRIEYHFRHEFLPQFLAEARIAEATDFTKLSTPDLFNALERLHNKFVHETHVEVDMINIAANFYVTRARNILEQHGLDASEHMGHIPETEEERAIAEAVHAPPDERRSLLTASMGHRATLDYELSAPRYYENPHMLDGLAVRRARPTPASDIDTAPQRLSAGLDKRLITAITTARRFQALKQDARHHSLRELTLLRRIILALDARLELAGMSFFLSLDELLALRSQSTDMAWNIAHARQKERDQLLSHESPATALSARDIELISVGAHAVRGEHRDAIRGTHVSGSGMVTGRARVVSEDDAEAGSPLPTLEHGDIIVASMIHPAWLPYFERSGGLVCEVGGWLSHTAIVAREYNTTMIVGTRGLSAITDGSVLRLYPDGRVEMLPQEELINAVAAE